MEEAIAHSEDDICLKAENLWKIFGERAGDVLNSDLRSASRESILEETGCVMAVRDVSFQVKRGEIFVVMGLSGSGKSTLVRLLLRLLEPTAGKVYVNGENICGYDDEQILNFRRHSVAMVFQHYGLFPHRSVIDNVAYGLKVRGVSEKERYDRAQKAIETVGLQGWEQYPPSALSGGMQQRVGIARALANDPEILLLDEPFSGLDPLIRRGMQDELLELQEKVQKTMIFVTHDLHEALKIGNRIAIMKDGEIIQIGAPEDVIISPADDYVREFVLDASPSRVLTAKRVMNQPEALLYEWQGPKTALHVLRNAKEDHAFMVSRGCKLLGLITMHGLRSLIQKKEPFLLKDALEPDIQIAGPDMILKDLFPLAAVADYPIAIVDENGRFMGEVQISSIFESMVQGKEEENDA